MKAQHINHFDHLGTLPDTVARRDILLGISMATLLGLILVWGVGFSHINAFHNAAHDTRHSNGFPCH
ncbi:MAG: CbtB-domain containing protein [Alphaproteobacteria bacterium]|nr:CbtB-domain containing protein [Alphaproteobacteria bacterium]